MLNRQEWYQLLKLPEEKQSHEVTAKSQAFGPGQLNTYARFIEDIENSFIVYAANITPPRKYKVILSDKSFSSASLTPSFLFLMDATLTYSEVYPWEGPSQSFSTLSPINNVAEWFARSASTVAESKEKIIQSLVQQGYSLEEFVIIDSETLLQLVDAVMKKTKVSKDDQYTLFDSIFYFSQPFNFEKMLAVSHAYNISSPESKRSVHIQDPNPECISFLKANPHIGNVTFRIEDQSQFRDVLPLINNLKKVNLILKCDLSDDLEIADDFCEVLKIDSKEHQNYNTLRIYSSQKPCMNSLSVGRLDQVAFSSIEIESKNITELSVVNLISIKRFDNSSGLTSLSCETRVSLSCLINSFPNLTKFTGFIDIDSDQQHLKLIELSVPKKIQGKYSQSGLVKKLTTKFPNLSRLLVDYGGEEIASSEIESTLSWLGKASSVPEIVIQNAKFENLNDLKQFKHLKFQNCLGKVVDRFTVDLYSQAIEEYHCPYGTRELMIRNSNINQIIIDDPASLKRIQLECTKTKELDLRQCTYLDTVNLSCFKYGIEEKVNVFLPESKTVEVLNVNLDRCAIKNPEVLVNYTALRQINSDMLINHISKTPMRFHHLSILNLECTIAQFNHIMKMHAMPRLANLKVYFLESENRGEDKNEIMIPDSVLYLVVNLGGEGFYCLSGGKHVKHLVVNNPLNKRINLFIEGMKKIDNMEISSISEMSFRHCEINKAKIYLKQTGVISISNSRINDLSAKVSRFNETDCEFILDNSQIGKVEVSEYARANFKIRLTSIGSIYCHDDSHIILPKSLKNKIPIYSKSHSRSSADQPEFSLDEGTHDHPMEKSAWSFSLSPHATPDADTENPETHITAGEGNIEIYSHPSVVPNYRINRVAPKYYRIQVAAACQYDHKSGKIKFNFEPDANNLTPVPLQILPLEKNSVESLKQMVDQNPEYALTYLSYDFPNNTWVPLATESALASPYHGVIIYTNHPEHFLKDAYWSESQAQLFLRRRDPKDKPLDEKIQLFFLYKKGESKVPSLPELDPNLKKYLYDTLKGKSQQSKYKQLQFLFDDNISDEKKLEKLVNYCHFESKELALNTFQKIFLSPIDIIIQEILERRGVCRHRAQCFFLLARMLNFPALMRENNLHAVVEVMSESGTLRMQDLGGGDPSISEDRNKKNSIFNVSHHAVPMNASQASPSDLAMSVAPTTTASSSALTYTSSQSIFSPQSSTYLQYRKTFRDLLAPVMIANMEALKGKALEKPAPLVLLNTSDEVNHMVRYLTTQAGENEKVIYIHTPSDLKRFFSTYQINNGKRSKQEGPLSQLIKSGGMLVINWSNFTSNQLASYQSLIDKEGANLWGNSIDSQRVRVIGLGLKQTAFHRCASFLSRCQEMHLSPTFLESINQTVQPVSESTTKSIMISLFGLPDWKEILFGKVIIEGKQYQYQKGQLQKAIDQQCSEIIILDPPKDPEFNHFVYHINHATGKWIINHEEISIPKIKIQAQKQNLACDAVKVHIDAAQPDKRHPIFLSAQTFHLLFTQQVFTQGGGKTCPGLLASYQSDQQYFLIHGMIPSALWEKMIAYIKENHPEKAFDFYLSPGAEVVKYHSAISKPDSNQSKIIPPEALASSDQILLVSDDPDFYEKNFLAQHPEFKVVHLTPFMDESDIIFKSSISTQADNQLRFEAIYQQVFLSLKRGDNILLQGLMSPSLYQALFPLIAGQKTLYVNGKVEEMKGQLRIILPTQAANQLMLDHPAEGNFLKEQYKAHFSDAELPIVNRVMAFYDIAKQIPLGGMGRPPHLRLNYQRLQHSVKAIQRNLHFHNPLKSVFHYDFPKKSDEYAYLSVLSKWMFAQDDMSGINLKRLKSLLKNKDETEWMNHVSTHPWIWLNCFRGNDLRKLFGDDWTNVIDKACGIPNLHEKMHQTLIAKIKGIQMEKVPLRVSKQSQQKKLKTRLTKLLNEPSVSIIFLKGDPGVGKTYTLRKLQKKYQFQKYEFSNPQQFMAWLKNDGKKEIPLLSVDEANFMLPGMLDFLKGIKIGKIYYQGEWHTLTDRHKVMLTGNPEYFPGRHYHDFIRDEAVTLYVNKTEKEFLLKLLNKHLKNKLANFPEPLSDMIESLVTIYQTVQQFNPTYVYSLRDLESLMERFVSRIKNNEDVKTALFLSAQYEFLGTFIDEQACKQFTARLAHVCETQDKMVTPKVIELNAEKKIAFPGEMATVIQAIEENVKIDENISKTHQDNFMKRGVLLEGEVGIGKTTLLKTILEKNDFVYEKAHVKSKAEWKAFMEKEIDHASIPSTKKYIEMYVVEPENKGAGVSSTSEFSDILIQAFHEGKSVIINELNLDPSLEILLNQLLNGYDPLGNLPKINGFRVYASQNPSSDEGRRPQSLAIKNRLHVHYLKPFSKIGLENLAEYKGVPDHQAFVRAYLDEKNQDSKVTMRNYFNAMDLYAIHNASIIINKSFTS